MTSFQLSITPKQRGAGRFIAKVRRALQKALAEEKAARGLTQSEIARVLGVHRSVINRQLSGFENLTLGRVGELAHALGREPELILHSMAPVVGQNFPAGEIVRMSTGTATATAVIKEPSKAA
jgi:transcriptional regulator with XRE-family HTH domain